MALTEVQVLHGHDVAFLKEVDTMKLLEESKNVYEIFFGKTTHGSMYSPGATNPRNHITPTWARGLT
jgi:hypothetical protein